MSRGRIAISMGDPTGIGPEVTLKALARAMPGRTSPVILVGDQGVYADTARRLRLGQGFASWAPPAPLPLKSCTTIPAAASA